MLRDATEPDWPRPRQVRLSGVLTKEAQLQLDALGSYPCTIELRDSNGRRFFLSQARIVELTKTNGMDPTLVVDVNVVLVVDEPEDEEREERQRATLAECIRLKREPHAKHGRVRRADVEMRNREIRKMRAEGTPCRVIAEAYSLSKARVTQILNEDDHPLEKTEDPAAS